MAFVSTPTGLLPLCTSTTRAATPSLQMTSRPRVAARQRLLRRQVKARVLQPAWTQAAGAASAVAGGWGNGGKFLGHRWYGRGGDDGDDGKMDGSSAMLPAPAAKVLAEESLLNDVDLVIPPADGAFIGDPSKPLIILLSWMGAKQKHMDKISSYYQDRGCEVVSFLNGAQTALLPHASQAQARKIASLLSAQPDGRPVFVHAFSIGTGIYGFVLDMLRRDAVLFEKLQRNVAGVIMDSGPAMIFPKDVAVGLHSICPTVSRKVWNGVANGLFWMSKARQSFGVAEEALHRMHFPSPQMYFASSDDKVIRGLHQRMGGFMDANRQRGLEVYAKFWDKSAHATHFKIHTEEYGQKLEKFMTRCLEWQKTNNAQPAPAR